MKTVPESIASFLEGKRIAVAGVSRKGDTAASFILKKLLKSGYEPVPVNPHADEIDGLKCYPDLKSIPNPVDAVMIATHPDQSAAIAEQCAELGITKVWFHRSFGEGSVSEKAIETCRKAGTEPIVGGCPLMYIEPVDIFHSCTKWWLGKRGQIPV
ncbi:MAG: CoA-binding protein [Balneolia bacterium]|nr:CoA-binding protein [Balneolia bacterium]